MSRSQMLAEISLNPLKSDTFQKADCTKHELGASLPQLAELGRGAVSHRGCFLGVETQKQLIWESWEPGREVTKSLTLKNIHSKLQKLHFKPPISGVFITLFPKTIVLSPGTSFSLPVTFRPLEKREYSDSIEFRSRAGTFRVSLRAAPPRHALEVPDTVLLPPCAVQDTSRVTFVIRNASKLQTSFTWEVEAPFRLSPMNDVLAPGEECSVTVYFRPQQALVYQEEARCVYGDLEESRATVLLRGLSKYPHLQVCTPQKEGEWSVLDFGSVSVGKTKEKYFDIFNPCQVSAPFRLSMLHRPALLEEVFQCDVREGRVEPRASLKVPVRFSPQTVDCTSVDYYSVTCSGGVSKTILKVTGTCVGPLVTLEVTVLDFGCLELGTEAVRTVTLSNCGLAEARFQFDVDPGGHGVFGPEPPCGILPPRGSLTIRVRFRPRLPIAHYRRVACLVLHRDPLFLDLIGTCHSEQLKPAILKPRHLRLYWLHLARGLTCYPPDVLSTMLEENKLQLDQEGALLLPEDLQVKTPVLDPTQVQRAPAEEYLQGSSGVGSAVTVDPPELLFHRGSRSLSVSVTNRTKGTLSLAWTMAPDWAFSVEPASRDLAPLKSTAFRVVYAPPKDNTLHGAQLECFAFYKVLRNHHQADDRTLCPPCCVTLRVSGHSFQPGCEHFTPRVILQRPLVVFPPLAETCYQMVLLQNAGDLPLTFRLDPDEGLPVSVRPTTGLVAPGAHQILMLRSTPEADRPREHALPLWFNGTSKHTQVLTVLSSTERPQVSLESDGGLFFQPTAVGSCSIRSWRIRNESRVPLSFHWSARDSEDSSLSVDPEDGVLQPNESLAQVWSFTPLAESLYTLKPSLMFWPTQSPGCRKSRLSVRVMGFATQGSIQAECPVLDLGEVLVGGCQSCDLPLLNHGPCALRFSLDVQQSIMVPVQPQDAPDDPIALKLERLEGTIAARCRMLIRCTARLTRRASYCWSIRYQIVNWHGSVMSEPQALCRVQGRGSYPTLEVVDAEGCGAAEGLGRMQLWSMLSLSGLNAYLCQDPSLELALGPGGHSPRRRLSGFTPVMLDFDLCAAPLGSEPSSVTLTLENTGNITAEWCFLFPEDQKVKLEYWAETSDPSSAEQLFSVAPRAGKLHPGQQGAVQLIYRHDLMGRFGLPVLLKVSHGRQILLNFTGVTVACDQPYVHFTSSKHNFAPVAIGEFDPPRQTCDLYNAGAVPATYRVDITPLQQLTADNFGHPVLQCLNPSGEVQPGLVASLLWIFSPLEAKTYSVDVSIHILEGDSTLVTLQGCGFDARTLGDSPPLWLQGDQADVPRPQREPLPGQLAVLSLKQLSLGDVPICSRTTRIFFLMNVSSTDTVLYSWNLAQQAHCSEVQIHPEDGALAVGESVLCTLTLQAVGGPCIYTLDLICQVTAEGAVVQYERELQQWEQEGERQRDEFIITESGVQPPAILQGCDTAVQNADPPVRRYKTLPPIPSARSRLPRAERRALRNAPRVWRRPEPPRAALLHLGVTARSHSLPDVQRNFPCRFHTHYIQSSKRSGAEACESRPPLTDSPLSSERDVVTHVLTCIIRSLLEDPLFHQSLVESFNEPVPYFSQLRTMQLQHPRPPPPSEPPPPNGPVRPGGSVQGPGFSMEPQAHLPVSETQQDRDLQIQEIIRRLPEFHDLTEDVLLNTLQNLMKEAYHGEWILTARPRAIALPPTTGRRSGAGREPDNKTRPDQQGSTSSPPP
nr:cilia- and flagella-associated protein 65 isoform X2 [Paramormyrops kingsleyae]